MYATKLSFSSLQLWGTHCLKNSKKIVPSKSTEKLLSHPMDMIVSLFQCFIWMKHHSTHVYPITLTFLSFSFLNCMLFNWAKNVLVHELERVYNGVARGCCCCVQWLRRDASSGPRGGTGATRSTRATSRSVPWCSTTTWRTTPRCPGRISGQPSHCPTYLFIIFFTLCNNHCVFTNNLPKYAKVAILNNLPQNQDTSY